LEFGILTCNNKSQLDLTIKICCSAFFLVLLDHERAQCVIQGGKPPGQIAIAYRHFCGRSRICMHFILSSQGRNRAALMCSAPLSTLRYEMARLKLSLR